MTWDEFVKKFDPLPYLCIECLAEFDTYKELEDHIYLKHSKYHKDSEVEPTDEMLNRE